MGRLRSRIEQLERNKPPPDEQHDELFWQFLALEPGTDHFDPGKCSEPLANAIREAQASDRDRDGIEEALDALSSIAQIPTPQPKE